MSGSSKSNLRKHLWHGHGLKEYLTESQQKRLLKDQEVKTLDSKLKKALDKALIECIIRDSRPFNDFRKPGMLKFLKKAVPGYKPPHRTTVAKRNKIEYIKYRSKLKDALKLVDWIALTTDMWKNRNGSYYLSLTGHFFDTDLETVSLNLAFRRFYGRQLSTRLETFILNEITKLDISEKVVSITTDNAADIKSAGSRITDRFSCMAHNINLILKNGLGLWKKKYLRFF